MKLGKDVRTVEEDREIERFNHLILESFRNYIS